MNACRIALLALCLTAAMSTAAVAAQDALTLCADTGGAWNECGSGCGPYTCDFTPPPIGEGAMGCPAVCVAQCACPESAPLWDEEAGCVPDTSCSLGSSAGQQLLCGESGGSWTTCGGCGPMFCGQDPELFIVCPPSCEIMCNCPEDAPYWDATIGCHDVQDCDSFCGEDESWNAGVAACCPDVLFTADCECAEGYVYLGDKAQYDDKGCVVGYVCDCVPEGSLSCEDGETWDIELQLCCPNTSASPGCECEGGTVPESTPVLDADGCVMDYTCECVPDESASCEAGETWDAEVEACCPDAIYVEDCLCEAGFEPSTTIDTDAQGCLLGYGCECLPSEENPFTDNDSDGYTSDVDCDDNDAAVHPGALELCNGVDDDCDAEVDEAACDITPGACDDDLDALCDMEPPTCEEGLMLAVQQGCYVCVVPETCAPPVAPEVALCEATGGSWDTCGCPAYTCENLPPGPGEEALPCPPACWEVCECPESAPVWDATLGCIPQDQCEGEGPGPDDGPDSGPGDDRPSGEDGDVGPDDDGDAGSDDDDDAGPGDDGSGDDGDDGAAAGDGGGGCAGAPNTPSTLVFLALSLLFLALRRRAVSGAPLAD